MLTFFSELFSDHSIDLFAPIRLSDCRVIRPYLLERAGITDGTALMIAVPYYSRFADDPSRNLSAYAVARDYHLFFRRFFEEALERLRKAFPDHRFAGFADHSPIDEVDAAVRAGLGVLGRNHLLLTKRYSSYIFLGEIITDVLLPTTLFPLRGCENCGACAAACPKSSGLGCLSALTQKKGVLSEPEKSLILQNGSVWGCDICQEVCPYTLRAREAGTICSPVPFFSESAIPHLDSTVLDGFSDEEFSERAYSWRGKETISRNLLLFESHSEKEASEC